MESKPVLVEIPRFEDPRGNLSFIQGGQACPFEIRRVYWTYDIPSSHHHLGRALRTTAELLVAMSGAFAVETEMPDGTRREFILSRPDRGVYLPPMTWRRLHSFSGGAVAMVLADRDFDADDYIRSLDTFRNDNA